MSSSRSNCRPQLLYSTLQSQSVDAEDLTPNPVSAPEPAESALLMLLQLQDVEGLATFLQNDATGIINAPLQEGDTALHMAAMSGSVPLTQTLCAFGCQLDVANAQGLTALHLAVRRGHTEVVRCLCLAGCGVDIKSRDGILPEVMSMAQGHDDITDLITICRNSSYREEYVRQLVPGTSPLQAVKVKLLGFSGVGKTELRKCLSASMLSSLLSLRLTAHPAHDVKESRPKALDEMELSPASPPSSLQWQPQDHFTRGIDVQQVNMSVCGHMSVWEFSGHPSYHCVYDHFLGSSDCAHLIVFPLDVPLAAQLHHCRHWLAFLRARIAPHEPLGVCGRPHRAPRVGLVGTKADVAQCPRTPQGEYLATHSALLLSKMESEFDCVFELHDEVFVLDCTTTTSAAVRAVRQYLADVKTAVTAVAPPGTGLLRQVARMWTEWRDELEDFPVVSWTQFVDAVHRRVNPLACEDHLREVVQQLQLQGQLVYLAGAAQDLLVLDPGWLTHQQLGSLLHPLSKLRSRVTGCFTVDDFQMRYPHCDALDLMTLLEALSLCTQCDNDGDIEYEFPLFNSVETLDGLWDKTDPRYSDAVYGGVRLKSQYPDMKHLAPVFARVQVQLRRCWLEYGADQDSDLYQWGGGSKFCCGPLECLASLEEAGETIEIKVRGPRAAACATFFFLEDLLAIVDQVLLEMCPGLVVHKHILSGSQLTSPLTSLVHAWSPAEVFLAALEGGPEAPLRNPYTGASETFSSLVWLDAPQVCSVMLTGAEVSVLRLCTLILQQLAALLDPSHPRGADWCVLAVRVGLEQQLPHLELSGSRRLSPTIAVLTSWADAAPDTATVGALIRQLQEMGREDAAELLLSSAPLYHLTSRDTVSGALSHVLAPAPSPALSLSQSQSLDFAFSIPKEFLSSPKEEEVRNRLPISVSSDDNVGSKNKSRTLGESKRAFQRQSTISSSGSSLATTSSRRPDLLSTKASSSESQASSHKGWSLQESLFTSDDPGTPNKDDASQDSLPRLAHSERSVSPSLFTLEEAPPSPTAFSSIPATSQSPQVSPSFSAGKNDPLKIRIGGDAMNITVNLASNSTEAPKSTQCSLNSVKISSSYTILESGDKRAISSTKVSLLDFKSTAKVDLVQTATTSFEASTTTSIDSLPQE